MAAVGVAIGAAASSPPVGGTVTAAQALARYRDMTGAAPTAAVERRRCAEPSVQTGEIVVCAPDSARNRLTFPDAHQRALPGDRILHPDEVPRADGRIDVAPCGANCPDAPHAPETFRRALSWLKGEDPD